MVAKMKMPNSATKEESKTARARRESTIHLRLLNLTDLHMEIRGYDYYTDQPTEDGGLARAASFVERLRSEAPNCLLFDNGDNLQGNPMGDLAAAEHARGNDTPHPMIAALNTLRPDAATLGNHEFNYGLSLLNAALTQARYPIVSANLLLKKGDTVLDDETLFPPCVMLDRELRDETGAAQPIRIGVIGVLPPQTLHWDSKHLAGRVAVRDIVETLRAYVPKMKSDGADLIVALSHAGIDGTEPRSGMEDASLHVAATEGVDVIITGHSHLVFPSPDFAHIANVDATRGLLHGKPATMAGFGGSHVGLIDLSLTRAGKGWRIDKARVSAAPVPRSDLPISPVEREILTATEEAHRATLAYIRRPVGRTDQTLDSYFAMIAPALSVLFVATAQHRYVRQRLKGTEYESLPLLSAAAPFKMGGRGGPDNFAHAAAGNVAMRNVADLYGYPNTMRALLVSGAALLDWLEFSACIFREVRAGTQDQPLVDPDFPPYNFDTLTGLTYDIDLTQRCRFARSGERENPKAQRVRNARWQGRPIEENQQFVVATNDFRASGSGTFPGADDGDVILSTPDANRDILLRFLQETPADRALAKPPWTFAACPSTSVTFETSPAARKSDRLQKLGVEVLDMTANGFLLCRKHL